ncbi:PIF1-like helicase-domain-containing protein, partial [Mycena crocata]
MPPSDKEKKGTYTANKVEVVPHDYLNPKSRLSKEANDTLISDICKRPGLELNQEQERAFRIVAEHASNMQPTPLKMYLGGMGGSGKSAVFRAIMDFFIARKEEYRFMVVAPTGATAALLKGSTYHSVFRIPRERRSRNSDDLDGIPNDATSVAAINERLQGVEYVLLDEISMVSCEDLQILASQAAKARNIHDVEFGG